MRLCLLLLFWGGAAFADPALVDRYRQGQTHWPAATLDAGIRAAPLAALPAAPPCPASNPCSEASRVLGKQLFFERRLSGSGQLACASCHDPDLGWADGRRQAIGHNRQVGDMHSPTVVNSGYLQLLFWDGRVDSLEQQAMASWLNPVEMAGDPNAAIARLERIPGYTELFTQAYGDASISRERIVNAIASFSRSLTLTNSRFDQFMRGNSDALSEQEIRGLHLFRTKARCMNCHNGPLLSDQSFHHLGTSFHTVGNFKGRYSVTGDATEVGAFRTPPLRGVGKTAPYMHTGLATDLDMLLSLYNMGWWQNAEISDSGDSTPQARLSPQIKALDLQLDELADLKAFLLSLTGNMPYIAPPPELPEAASAD